MLLQKLKTRSRVAMILPALACFLWINTFLLPGVSPAFSIGDERQAGEQMLTFLRKEIPFLDDPDISQYINKLGKSIVKGAGSQFFDYRFFVIDNKEFNAFAAPSGVIVIHSGLIETMDTEGELYSVMAHEVGHATSRHIAERIDKSKNVTLTSLALILAGIALNSGELSEAVLAGSLAAGESMNLYFSRQNEEESDRLAYKWMKANGRNTDSMVSMLQKMRRISLYRQGDIPPYLLTHPEPEVRMHYVQDLIALDKEKPEFPAEDNFDFLRIKGRILALTKSSDTLKPRYYNIINNSKNPESLETLFAQYGLSQTYLAGADFKKAEESLLKIMPFFPDRPILKTDLGLIYYQQGNYNEAEKYFLEVRQESPDSLYTAFNLALVYEHRKDYSKAIPLFNEILNAMPEYARVYYHLGQIMAATGEKTVGYYYMGAFHWYNGDTKNAAYHLRKVVEDLPPEHELSKKAKNLLALIKAAGTD